MSGAGLGNTGLKSDCQDRVQLDAAGTRGGFNPLFRRRGAGGWLARLAGLVPAFSNVAPGFSGVVPGFSGVVPEFSGVVAGFSNVVAGFYEGVFLRKVGRFGRKMADLARFLMRPASYDSGLRFGVIHGRNLRLMMITGIQDMRCALAAKADAPMVSGYPFASMVLGVFGCRTGDGAILASPIPFRRLFQN